MARSYLEQSVADNTRRAYSSDVRHFRDWGGLIPSDPATVATYLAACATRLSVATLIRRTAALSRAHEAGGWPNPARSELVRAVLRGIRRSEGRPPEQARPLLKEHLVLVINAIGESVRDRRDRALLLLGFAGGFRRSELVGLDRVDLEVVRQGVVVTLRRSKTDQLGEGRKLGIPHGRTNLCPVNAVLEWLEAGRVAEGPIFRPVDRRNRSAGSRLSGQAVSMIVQARVAAAGIDPRGFSGHSLRAGLATSAAAIGVPTHKIRAQTGHASDAMLSKYIRDGELFRGNAAGLLL